MTRMERRRAAETSVPAVEERVINGAPATEVEHLVDSIESYNDKHKKGVIMGVLFLGGQYLLTKLQYNGVRIIDIIEPLNNVDLVRTVLTLGGVVGVSKALINKIRLTKNIRKLNSVISSDETPVLPAEEHTLTR